MSSILSDAEKFLLEQAATSFGDGVKNLGRDSSLFDMESFTLSVTFELNSLTSGNQALLWNHMQYGISVENGTLQIALRGADGELNYINVPDAFSDTGWHDVQVVSDATTGNLNFWVDGAIVYSGSNDDVTLEQSSYWDVTAGGTPWGREVDGQVADVSILNEAIDIDSSLSLAERMYELDANDTVSILAEPELLVEPLPSLLSEEEMLADAATEFGDGTVDLGNDPSMYGMESLTLSVTFELNSLSSGTQALLYSNKQYAIMVLNDDLRVSFRGTDGKFDHYRVNDVFDETGWHDVQVVLDDDAGSLQFWLDGDMIYSGTSEAVALTADAYSNVAAGGKPNGKRELDGRVADVVIEDEAMEIDGSLSIYDRMIDLTDGAATGGEPPAENVEAIISGDDVGVVVEDVELTTNGKLNADDADAGQSGFQATTLTGAYGELSIDAEGNWTYAALDTGAVQALTAGTNLSESFTVYSIDGTPKEIVLTIEGTNDTPVITGEDSGLIVEEGVLASNGKLVADDADASESGFRASSSSGTYGDFSITASGNWSYVAVNAAAIDALGAGDQATETFTVLSIDGTPKEVTITINGTNDVPVITGDDSGTVTEDGILTSTGTLVADDADTGESGFQAATSTGNYGDFSIDANGNWTYAAVDNEALQALDSGESFTETFTVLTLDGTSKTVSLSVNGVDEVIEPPVGTETQAELLGAVAAEFGAGVVDLGRDAAYFEMDDFTISATFEMNSLSGGSQTILWNHMEYGISVSGNDLKVALRDTDGNLKYYTVSDVVDEAGWHDVQITYDSAGGGLAFYLDGAIVYSGTDVNIEIDTSSYWNVTAGGTPWGAPLDGQVADISIHDNVKDVDGSETIYDRMYSMDEGDITTSLPQPQETPSDGETGEPPVGNVEAVISGDESGSVVEEGILTSSGTLVADDADSGESGFQASGITGNYGDFSITASGNWSYMAANAAAINALGAGDQVTEIFTIFSIDGTPKEVTITINGTNDVPVITGNDSGTVTEDGSLTTSGTLVANDVDTGESGFQAATSTGSYGDFTVDAKGNWTYAAVDNEALQALDSGESFTETFTVLTLDGTSKTVTVSVNGVDEVVVPPVDTETQAELLDAAAADFGTGVVGLGRDTAYFGMEDFTISATFEMNSVSGGNQAILWNHMQYGISVNDNDLKIALRGSDGKLNYYTVSDVFDEAGWHDVQVVLDSTDDSLEFFVDGAVVFTGSGSDVEIGTPASWDVTSGGTLWGNELDGQVADISVHDVALEIDGSETVYDRMYSMDEGDATTTLSQPYQSPSGDVPQPDPAPDPAPDPDPDPDPEPEPEPEPEPSGTVIEIANVAQLQQALSSNLSGVTLRLAPGDYSGVSISGLNPIDGISIMSADPNDPARFSSANIENSSNFSFDNIEFRADSVNDAYWDQYIVRVSESSDIEFSDSVFAGGPGMLNEGLIGLYVINSDGVTVSNNEFTNSARGAIYSHSDNLTIEGNDIHDIQSDGFDFVAVQDVVIDQNTFGDFYPVEGDHADYIQFWLVGANRNSENVTISNNFMAKSDGDHVQGIFITETDPNTNVNFVIENNVIYQSGYHGISVYGADGLTIQNNTVLAPTDSNRDTWINVTKAPGAEILNNIANTYLFDDAALYILDGNVYAQADGVGGESYSDLFVGPLDPLSSEPSMFETLPGVSSGAEIEMLGNNGGNMIGDLGNNFLSGTADNETLKGFAGDDTLSGGAGDDLIIGGQGTDILTGGAGSDIFEFSAFSDSAIGVTRDVISDFDAADLSEKISFSGMVEQGFEFIGSSAFYGPELNSSEKLDVLQEAATNFGSGLVNLGRGDDMFDMESMTLSVTFELNDLTSGSQALLYNHIQYAITVNDNDLEVTLQQDSGTWQTLKFADVISEAGWHDTQVIVDNNTNTLEVWLDGDTIYSGSSASVNIGSSASWDVTAGATPWGSELNGQIADVSILSEAIEPSILGTYDRTVQIDAYDEFNDMELAAGNTQVRFDDISDILSVDLDGDQIVDMEVELIGVSLANLDNSDFLY